jgi:hypothetical protein
MNPCQSSEGAVVPEENRVPNICYGGSNEEGNYITVYMINETNLKGCPN